MAADDHDLTIEPLGDPGGAGDPATADAPPPARLPARRRLAVAVAAVVALLVVTALAGGHFGTAAPRPVPTPTGTDALVRRLELAGFTGPTGGSLAGDRRALAGIRGRALELADRTGQTVTPPAQVHALWAGDLNGGRYALVLSTGSDGGWSLSVLAGPAGADPGQLAEVTSGNGEAGDAFGPAVQGYPTQPDGIGVHAGGDAAHPGVVLVVAPRATGVEIATGSRFSPDGVRSTSWRALPKQGGSVWVGVLTATEEYLGSYRTAGSADDGVRPIGVVGRPEYGSAAVAAATGAAARTESGDEAVRCALDATRSLGASPAERIELATTTRFARKEVGAAVVLRSPDGGRLVGLCWGHVIEGGADDLVPYGRVLREPYASDAAVEVITPAASSDGTNPRRLVLAPAGTGHVRVGRATVPVHDRLALVGPPHRSEEQP